MPPLYVRLFGYYRVKTEEKYKTRLQNLFLTLRINAYPAKKDGFFIAAKDLSRLLSAAKRERLSVSVGEICGLPRRLYMQRHRIGLPLGILCAVLVLWLGTHHVWRVEVSGNETVTEEAIVEGLSSLGFGVGSNTKVENADGLIATYLLSHPEIAWMGIYTEGTTAHVRVIENKAMGDREPEDIPSHLVATKDALIVRLDITHGTAAVKQGSVVKRGDVLALGLISGAHHDTLLAAKGEVIGRVSESFRVEIPYVQTEKWEKERKKLAFDMIFFEKTINIFKKTSKNPMDYVIIERKETLSLPNGLPLPLGYIVKEAVFYGETERTLEKEEAILEGAARIEEQIRAAVGDGVLLSREMRIEEKEDACVLYATVEYTQNIAEQLPFTVN